MCECMHVWRERERERVGARFEVMCIALCPLLFLHSLFPPLSLMLLFAVSVLWNLVKLSVHR